MILIYAIIYVFHLEFDDLKINITSPTQINLVLKIH